MNKPSDSPPWQSCIPFKSKKVSLMIKTLNGETQSTVEAWTLNEMCQGLSILDWNCAKWFGKQNGHLDTFCVISCCYFSWFDVLRFSSQGSCVSIVTSRTRHKHVHVILLRFYAFHPADRLCMFTALDQFKHSCVYPGRLVNYSLRRRLFSPIQGQIGTPSKYSIS